MSEHKSEVCPNCGYCPHCKRPAMRTYPYWQWVPQPTYYPTWISGGTTTSGSDTISISASSSAVV